MDGVYAERITPSFFITSMVSRIGENMIINSSNVAMDSSRFFSAEQTRKSVSLINNSTNNFFNRQIGNSIQGEITVNQSSLKRTESEYYFRDALKMEMVDDATDNMEKSLLGMRSGGSNTIRRFDPSSHENAKRVREQTLIYLIRFLYNRMWRKGEDENLADAANNQLSVQSANQNNVIGYRENYYSYEEKEETSFNTTGKVITADGREISFDVELTMSRSFAESYYSREDIVSNIVPNLVDPLVINLDNNGAGVTDQKFYFDIDQDGILDSISRLDSGSGYLAIDLNEDGVINDGSELFGTKSGNGFYDLSKYDEDGNGWIDEADSVFSKLLIWTKDENGKDMLYHLKDRGVGAICLQNVSTKFDLKSLKDNSMNGRVKSSGVFLYENGNVGTMQQLDLAR